MFRKGDSVVLASYGDALWRDLARKPKIGTAGVVLAVEGSAVPGFVQTGDTGLLVKFKGYANAVACYPCMLRGGA